MRRHSTTRVMTGLAGTLFAGALAAADTNVATQGDRFDEALARIERSFREPLSRDALRQRAVRALVADLDPYGRVLDATELREFRTGFSGAFGGVGVTLDVDETRELPRIERLMIDSAAGAAGARPGDWIESIDGRSLEGRPLDEVPAMLRGEPGTVVHLRLGRPAGPSRTIAVTRKAHRLPSVHGVARDADGQADYLLDRSRGIGYVRVEQLAKDSVEEVESALVGLRKAGACALVLDLRGSSGGMMDAGVRIADLFLDKGLIAGWDGRAGGKRFEADPAVAWSAPMVVLIDERTASSSEFLAAALRDHHRARFMGHRTFGKGLVQEVFELGEGRGALILSTGRHVRPSGLAADRNDPEPERQRAGVAPDPALEVALTEAEQDRLYRALDLRASPTPVTREEVDAIDPDAMLGRAAALFPAACAVVTPVD